MVITRRAVLGWTTVLAAGATVGFAGLSSGSERPAGDLRPDPEGVLDLPVGFRYRVLQRAGDRMSDGRLVRPAPDGMAAFVGPGGTTVLMRNHELGRRNGGVSRLVLDAKHQVVHSNDVLVGTNRNCAGGPSPWGWLSCEETDNGGVWVCPTDATGPAPRTRVDGYGSFRHEAVAIDPQSDVAYLTEDHPEGYFYRFVPSTTERPFQGQLQAMTVPDRPGVSTAGLRPGDTIQVSWVDVRPDEAHASAKAAGAAVVVRGEGIWWTDAGVYLSATTHGQIFRFSPVDATRGQLTLVTSSLHAPDNITVAPSGVLYVAEDNRQANHIRTVAADGTVRRFAFNRLNPRDEFAGVCFSPRGDALFVNLQGSGLTMVIEGPFA